MRCWRRNNHTKKKIKTKNKKEEKHNPREGRRKKTMDKKCFFPFKGHFHSPVKLSPHQIS